MLKLVEMCVFQVEMHEKPFIHSDNSLVLLSCWAVICIESPFYISSFLYFKNLTWEKCKDLYKFEIQMLLLLLKILFVHQITFMFVGQILSVHS